MSDTKVIVRSNGKKPYGHDVIAGPHKLSADEPASLGGQDSGPDPYALVMAGLGACTSMTMKMYAQRKGWPLEDVEVQLTHKKIKRGDDMIDRFTRDIILRGPQLDADQRARLIEIANKCPVHKTLEGSGSEIETREIPAIGNAGPAPGGTPHKPAP